MLERWPDPQCEGFTRDITSQPTHNLNFRKWDCRWDHNLTSEDNLFVCRSSQ